MINLLIITNLALLLFVCYLLQAYDTLVKKIEVIILQNTSKEKVIDSLDNVDFTLILKVICIGLVLTVVATSGYYIINTISESSVCKIIKLVDQNVSNSLDYFFTPKTVMKFVEKSSGLNIEIEIHGDICILKVYDVIEKSMKPFSEIIESSKICEIPTEEVLDIAYKVWL